MKKLIVALSTIFCAFLIAVSIYTILPQNNPPSARSAAEQQYIVADWGGKVAVFEEGADQPFEVYDIYTHLLPENDIDLLRKGIVVNSLQQLQSCLEDLGL